MRRLRLLAALPLLLIGACDGGRMDVMFECPSPSGRLVATFYRISSGQRPGDQLLSINIRPAGSSFDSAMASFSFRHGYDAIMRWRGEHDLHIIYPAGSEIRHQEPVVFGTSQTFSASEPIRLDYEARPSTHGYFIVERRCLAAAE
jgi:hypothetical protein